MNTQPEDHSLNINRLAIKMVGAIGLILALSLGLAPYFATAVEPNIVTAQSNALAAIVGGIIGYLTPGSRSQRTRASDAPSSDSTTTIATDAPVTVETAPVGADDKTTEEEER